ncbi:hypothetical protein K438DRAFT_1779654 [Mycena galopus ATCC 62051]|nr:hypothetical protein K438DRAFT_1779654 [Mycena galopus ATCC 62051]
MGSAGVREGGYMMRVCGRSDDVRILWILDVDSGIWRPLRTGTSRKRLDGGLLDAADEGPAVGGTVFEIGGEITVHEDVPLDDDVLGAVAVEAGYVWLVKAKAEIEQHRRQFAFNAPPIVNDRGCENQAICAVTWKVEWGRTIPKVIHHPDVHISFPELLFSLEETEISDVCDACQKRTVAWIWGTNYATAEDDIVTRAVTALTVLQRTDPRSASEKFPP